MPKMSIEQFENIQNDNEICRRLKEAELQAQNFDVRFSHGEVFDKLKKQLKYGKIDKLDTKK